MLLRLPVCPVDLARRTVRGGLGSLFAADRLPEEQYDEPAGDAGLFGPDSVTWTIHADGTMFVGGIAALMLQSLHPRAAAGLADHRRFRDDPLRRLSRTGSFVAASTYAATPVAEQLIAIVRQIHTHVRGTTPDGVPYSATDPDLVTWVHVAEVTSFLRAHRRYHPFPFRGADLDRYYAETAVVARKLGGADVPASRAEMHDYFVRVRPELRLGQHASEMMAFLRQPIERDPVTHAVHALFIAAAIDLLPGWAREM